MIRATCLHCRGSGWTTFRATGKRGRCPNCNAAGYIYVDESDHWRRVGPKLLEQCKVAKLLLDGLLGSLEPVGDSLPRVYSIGETAILDELGAAIAEAEKQ